MHTLDSPLLSPCPSSLLPTQPESNYILTFRNEDRPGVISEVLQVLNNANVNVASLNVTRAGAGQVRAEDKEATHPLLKANVQLKH